MTAPWIRAEDNSWVRAASEALSAGTEVTPSGQLAGAVCAEVEDTQELLEEAAVLVRRLRRLHPDDGTGSPTCDGWLARYYKWLNEPFASDVADVGQLASAGEASVPPGLYRKFSVERTDGSSSPGGKHECCEYFVLDWAHDKYARPAALAYAKACEAEYPDLARDLRDRAAAVVAHTDPPRTVPLARDEPPAEQESYYNQFKRENPGALERAAAEDEAEEAAEQPSRQDTGGGDDYDWSRCGRAEARPPCLTSFRRDRAKAKAAEPSGTGQLPSAQQPPMVAIERTLNGADGQASMVCRLPDSRLIRIDVETDGGGCVTTYGSNGTPIYRELPGYEPIAEPPAHVAGTLSARMLSYGTASHQPVHLRIAMVQFADEARMLEARLAPAPAVGTLSEAINALPEQVRRYVHEIETNCDPAGTVRDNVLLRDHLAALEVMVAEIVRLHLGAEQAASTANEALRSYKAKLAQVERDRAHEQNGWNSYARKLEKERDEATAKLARVAELVGKIPTGLPGMHGLVRDIQAALLDAPSDGKPAPGTDNGVAENCASAAAAFAENMKDRPKDADDPQAMPPREVARVCAHGLDVRLANCPGCIADGLVAPPREKQDPGGLTPILGRLDPGIRATVCQIRAWGFVTTDSGDGVSKFKNGKRP